MDVNQCSSVIQDLKPVGGMVLVQMAFAGVNIFYKLALNDGMNVQVLVAYRYLFALASLGPVAFFLERKKRPILTKMVLVQTLLCGLFGGTLVQNLYIEGIKLTSVTFASAMANLIPAITFILAVACRLEKLSIRTLPGIAKVMGTVVGLGGAMLLTFYKGSDLNLWSTNVDLIHKNNNGREAARSTSNPAMGSLLCFASCISFAVWLIIQAKIAKVYPCPYSSTALMCAMASVLSVVYALCIERTNWSAWDLGFDVRLLAVGYCGVIATGPILALMAWCIRKKGPLFASVFNPLMLLCVAILASLLLQEKLHVGTLIGAVLIVIGLYMVIWGKGREVTERMAIDIIPSTLDGASSSSSFGQSSTRVDVTFDTPLHATMMMDEGMQLRSEEGEDRGRDEVTGVTVVKIDD